MSAGVAVAVPKENRFLVVPDVVATLVDRGAGVAPVDAGTTEAKGLPVGRDPFGTGETSATAVLGGTVEKLNNPVLGGATLKLRPDEDPHSTVEMARPSLTLEVQQELPRQVSPRQDVRKKSGFARVCSEFWCNTCSRARLTGGPEAGLSEVFDDPKEKEGIFGPSLFVAVWVVKLKDAAEGTGALGVVETS